MTFSMYAIYATTLVSNLKKSNVNNEMSAQIRIAIAILY